MKPLRKTGYCKLVNENTGRKDKIKIVVHEVMFEPALRRNRRVGEYGGFYPMRFAGSKRRAILPFRNTLEGAFLEWLRDCKMLQNVTAWPVTVRGTFSGVRRKFTPSYLVEIDPLSADLKHLGFGVRTFVDVKPEIYQNNWDVQLSLEMLRLATGFPVYLATEETIMISILNAEPEPARH